MGERHIPNMTRNAWPPPTGRVKGYLMIGGSWDGQVRFWGGTRVEGYNFNGTWETYDFHLTACGEIVLVLR